MILRLITLHHPTQMEEKVLFKPIKKAKHGADREYWMILTLLQHIRGSDGRNLKAAWRHARV